MVVAYGRFECPTVVKRSNGVCWSSESTNSIDTYSLHSLTPQGSRRCGIVFMLIIDALFWLFLSRQLDKNADEFIEETDWEQVQLQVSAETMGSFRRKRFTPYLGWWALYLFDVCQGWSVAYLKCFFSPFFRLYSVVWRIVQYVSCRLHPRDSTKRRTNLAPLFCCRVHMCSMLRAWMHLKNSHSTENQCVPCADHIITRNCCSGWKFFLFLYNSDNTIFSTD